MKNLFFLLLCTAIASVSASCVTPSLPLSQHPTSAQTPQPPKTPEDLAPLDLVIAQVKAALAEYQANLGGGADALPPLSTAEFDFKATTATTTELAVNLFIFKLGGSHEDDVVNDVTYTYSVPKPKPPRGKALSIEKPPLLKDALAQAIQSAAKAVKTAGTVGELPFNKLTVNIQYGVKWDGTIGANAPISLVTVGLSGEKNKNTVQSVTLVFEK